MFDPLSPQRLSSIEAQTPDLLKLFACFFEVKNNLQQWFSGDFKTLEIIQVDACIADVKFANTTVRFQLLFSYNDQDRATGRVICSLKHSILDKEHLDYLGEFSFDAYGNTTLPPTARGPRSLRNSVDEIVMSYLDKAVKQGPRWIANGLKESAALSQP